MPGFIFPSSKDWFIAGPVSGSPAAVFAYASGNEGVFNGTVSFSRASSGPTPTSAPEPATLALLALGVAGVGLMRFKTARSRAEGAVARTASVEVPSGGAGQSKRRG